MAQPKLADEHVSSPDNAIPSSEGVNWETRIARFAKEDSYGAAVEADASAIIRAATPGENELSDASFQQLLRFVYPFADYPKQHRQAKRSGRLQWGGGVVFVRAAE